MNVHRLRAHVAAACLALIASLAACLIHSTPAKFLAYTPRPERIGDPEAEVARILKANTGRCIVEPAVEGTLLLVRSVCSGGDVDSRAVKLDKVDRIVIRQWDEDFQVIVSHRGGDAEFTWISSSRDDMERLADALTALSTRP